MALIVSREGYPIGCQIFPGNKLEGHRLIPAILDLLKTHGIQTLTVVADAAMLSADNMQALKRAGLSYIVGARLKKLVPEVLKEAAAFLDRKEGKFFKKETDLGYLICDYSEARAAKDKSDRHRQILKAQRAISAPGKYLKRSRFVKETTASAYVLNEELIKRDELTDGIKGYHTNLASVPEDLIVVRYHDLRKIEKAFRIAKSDLLARPIFHRKEESIKTHILIVFMSLCLSKSIELKTGRSIKSIRDEIWEVLDIQFSDRLTGKRFVKRSEGLNLGVLK